MFQSLQRLRTFLQHIIRSPADLLVQIFLQHNFYKRPVLARQRAFRQDRHHMRFSPLLLEICLGHISHKSQRLQQKFYRRRSPYILLLLLQIAYPQHRLHI